CDNAEPAALADGEMDDSVVAAKHAAVEIDDFARSGGARTQPFDDVGIAAARHKADILTVLLIGDREPEAARQFTRLELGAVAEREAQQVELGGCRRKQEITLVALAFARAIERASAIRQPPRGDIVTGGQDCRAELARSRQQIAEFDRLVALDTRHRRLSGDIAFSEAIDDRLLEALLVVEDIMRNADPRGDRPGVVDVAAGAARA